MDGGIGLHPTREQLAAGFAEVRSSPSEVGKLELIVARPAENERELTDEGRLDKDAGLVGDMWSRRSSSKTDDGGPNPEAQVTVMNARAAALVAMSSELVDWAQAGDQLYVDLDLGVGNLPAGSRLQVGGEAVLEVTAEPHLGCGKFARRFGVEALKMVNSAEGREIRLRGINTRVVEAGVVRRGDQVRKL